MRNAQLENVSNKAKGSPHEAVHLWGQSQQLNNM